MKKNKLHTIKSTGFKTPNNYFKAFEAKLQKRLVEEKSIDAIESAGYSVPENYFETFQNKLTNKLKHENDKPVIALKPKRILYYFTGIAASFALLFSLIFNTEKSISMDAIDTAAIENYLYQEDYSNDELASLFKSNEISETDFIDVSITDETQNYYLENIDTEDLILE